MSVLQTIRRRMQIATAGALIGLVCGCGAATNGLGPIGSDDASKTPLDAAEGALDEGVGPLDDGGSPLDDEANALDDEASPLDAGESPLDATTDAASDGSVDALELCLTDAPLLNELNAMATDSDAGASSCFGCIVGTCPTQVTACASDCTCNEAVLTFAGCATDGGPPIDCALPLASSTDPATAALAACVGGGLFGGSGAGCIVACDNVSAAEGGAAAH
jgi:hypothetical protein